MIPQEIIDRVEDVFISLYDRLDMRGWTMCDTDFAVVEDMTVPSKLERVLIRIENEETNQYMSIHIDLRKVVERRGHLWPSDIAEAITEALQNAGIVSKG